MKLVYEQHTGPRRNRSHQFNILIDGKEYTIIENITEIILIDPNGEKIYMELKNDKYN